MNSAILIIIVLLVVYIGFRYKSEKDKYDNLIFKENIAQISLFFELVDTFDDYITWVKRDEIKTQFASIGKFFKNKTKYYSKEDNVRKFNEIFGNFDNYIVKYNQEYVTSQKERLKHYFDDIEGKKLDEQQRTAVITDEYSNLIVAGQVS